MEGEHAKMWQIPYKMEGEHAHVVNPMQNGR